MEAKTNTCHFESMNGVVLEKVCEYFYYNEKHKNSKDVPDIDVPAELCLELLMAADYLNGMCALDDYCKVPYCTNTTFSLRDECILYTMMLLRSSGWERLFGVALWRFTDENKCSMHYGA